MRVIALNSYGYFLNPTPVGGGAFSAPYRKMAITPKNNDSKDPKLCDFS